MPKAPKTVGSPTGGKSLASSLANSAKLAGRQEVNPAPPSHIAVSEAHTPPNATKQREREGGTPRIVNAQPSNDPRAVSSFSPLRKKGER
jgi:hypothetical protein